MLDGQLANKSEKFVYPSALVGPSKRDERFRKYNVYKYILPSVFERWDLTVLMKESVPVKVSFYNSNSGMLERYRKIRELFTMI